MLSGCKTSGSSGDAPALRIADLPAHVHAEASKVTELPPCDAKVSTGVCYTPQTAATLTTALRKSELRKNRAIKAAIKSHGSERARIAGRGKKGKK